MGNQTSVSAGDEYKACGEIVEREIAAGTMYNDHYSCCRV